MKICQNTTGMKIKNVKVFDIRINLQNYANDAHRETVAQLLKQTFKRTGRIPDNATARSLVTHSVSICMTGRFCSKCLFLALM